MTKHFFINLFKSLRSHWPIIIILLIALAVRLYRISEMALFDFDQEYAVNFARQVKEYPIRIVGQGLSVQGLFMGPWYFYLMTPFFWLTNLHPLGGYIGSMLLGTFTVYVYYWVATKMFGHKAGLMAAFLRAILFKSIYEDWAIVPSYSSDLLVVLLWYWLYLYWQRRSPNYIYAGLILGLFTSWHPIQFPFYFIFIVVIVGRLPKINLKSIFLFITSFIIPVSPLILFEYLRNFAMSKQILNMFTQPATESSNLSGRLIYLLNIIVSRVLELIDVSLQFQGSYIISIFIIFAIVYLAYKLSSSKFHLILIPTIILFIVYYLLFPTHVPDYYLGGISSLLLIYVSVSATFLYQTNWGKVILFFWCLGIISQTSLKLSANYTNPSLANLAHKDAIVREIKADSQGKQIYISYITELGWKFGYQYLIDYYHINQSSTAEGVPVYTIVSPRSFSPDSIGKSFGNIGIIYPDQK